MSTYKLVRFCSHNRGPRIMGVFGELFYEDDFICYTLERAWNNNKPFISCIPDGVYNLVKVNSEKYGVTYALNSPPHNVYAHKKDRKNETDRYSCLIHSANQQNELQGCIAPGLELGSYKNQWRLLRSRDALNVLRSMWYEETPEYLEIVTLGDKIHQTEY